MTRKNPLPILLSATVAGGLSLATAGVAAAAVQPEQIPPRPIAAVEVLLSVSRILPCEVRCAAERRLAFSEEASEEVAREAGPQAGRDAGAAVTGADQAPGIEVAQAQPVTGFGQTGTDGGAAPQNGTGRFVNNDQWSPAVQTSGGGMPMGNWGPPAIASSVTKSEPGMPVAGGIGQLAPGVTTGGLPGGGPALGSAGPAEPAGAAGPVAPVAPAAPERPASDAAADEPKAPEEAVTEETPEESVPEEAVEEEAPEPAAPPVAKPVPVGGGLPFTGAPVGIAVAGAGLLAAGCTLLSVRRRRTGGVK